MQRVQLWVSALLLVLLLASCAPAAVPAPAPRVPAAPAPAAPVSAPRAPAAPAKPAWEAEWEKTLAAAKQEGRIVINTAGGGDLRRAMMKVAKMQGLEAEVISGRFSELLAKLLAERRAGLYTQDIRLGGPNDIVNIAKPAGMAEPLDSALLLPHLTDPELIRKVWYQGQLPWVDRDHTVLIVTLQPGPAIAVNTNQVKPDEMKSWRDLLDPKWKGKVILNDPTIAGTGGMAVQAMIGIMGEGYVKELAKTEPIVMRDETLMFEWLAHGKVSVIVAPKVEALVELIKAGAPIKAAPPVEGTWLGAGNGSVGWFKNAPHPNASKVFINLITSKEGQDIFAPAGGLHSTRVDASTAHLRPEQMRQEGFKYFAAYTEEAYLKRPVTDKLAKDLFGPLIGK